MAKKRERAFALIAAFLFLLTSVGFSVFVIWSASHQDKTSDSITKKEPILKGTKLANFTPVGQVAKLQIIDLTPGTGVVAKAGDTVTAHYTGAVAKTGIIFESSHDSGQPATFPLGQVIKGWQEGVPGMKVGGTRRLIIPAALAYGAQSPSADIPANADLVFDIELSGVQ